ncbi:MAG: alpha-amylase [Acidobacteria bacterium]|nr:alpha-amylase [Acidobacteriota bacterium]
MRLLLSRGARRALQLEAPAARPEAIPSKTSEERLSESFREARILAEKLGPLLPDGAAKVSAGDLYAFGRLERALRAYLGRFLTEHDPYVLGRALSALDQRFGDESVNRLLASFQDEFLPDRATSLAPEPGGSPAPDQTPDPEPASSRRHGHQELLAELLIFSIIHANPAGAGLGQVLHSGGLVADPEYGPLVGALNELLDQEPGLHKGDGSLVLGLRRPIDSAPDSLADQLRWMIENWRDLSTDLEPELIAALDLIAEEEMPRFPPGPGPPETPAFDPLDDREVHYGSDRGWMSRLVLAAKNTHVWLHQLSSRYRRKITRLDQIPDAEFETLGSRGITGLWLIGLWERSRASRRIKQLCGNPEAAGSAYSLMAYRIADDLGGDEALESLEAQADRFGIRLSADMVPNHTGIDSEWMIEHPEWFLSVPICPFPSYTFNGPDLSSDRRVGIFLEDHYFDRTDAAVVFKRVDRTTGEVRFVYHGNDGTGTPWNDTAQLDYLNPATREAVTRTILKVAKRFPIIRFDAAMTLAQRHIQRLWYPEPGSAGAIPSRAEHAMSATEFNAKMPREFWREVVDRAETEAPGTLLLAEAFWLMEGYFVRNLGLHRVYNSAFMNMLRDHDNRGYRRLVRESLDFDAEILRRYVNFLSNPDERTAIEQFGDGDRYFGACVLLATMPGLPMFAHGQIEGLTERYGMEYRRAYVDEAPNRHLIERHDKQIVPLLRERRRFADVDGFSMHDFVDRHGAIDENVLAFSHGGAHGKDGSGDGGGAGAHDVSLVVFNNQPVPVRGVLKLNRDLGISTAADRLCRFRDRLSQRHFLRTASAIHNSGLELELAGYESLVLVDFRELAASEDGGIYPRLSRHLGLRGTPGFEEAGRQIHLEDARSAFGDILATLSVAAPLSAPAVQAMEEQLEELDRHLRSALEPTRLPGVAEPAHASDELSPEPSEPAEPAEPAHLPQPADLAGWLEAISRLAAVELALDWPRTERMLGALELLVGSEKEEDARFVLPAFALLGYVHQRWGGWALRALEPGPTLTRILADRSVPDPRAAELAALVDIASLDDWLETTPPPGLARARRILESATSSETAARILGYDRDADTLDGELLQRFLTWRATAAALSWLAAPSGPPQEASEAVVGWCDVLERLRQAIEEAEFQITPVIARLRDQKER